ncbi:hypothetical protein CFB39_09340 [Burkholderia sp. AU6039]|nr:hypothetical protein CFB39_09340 [Burkholderia sp. AU6039]
MPAPLATALDAGTVRTVHDERGATVYFIAPGVVNKGPIRRAIAQRRRWEIGVVCALGVAIGTALAGVAHFFTI